MLKITANYYRAMIASINHADSEIMDEVSVRTNGPSNQFHLCINCRTALDAWEPTDVLNYLRRTQAKIEDALQKAAVFACSTMQPLTEVNN
jgi:hypothetical protein